MRLVVRIFLFLTLLKMNTVFAAGGGEGIPWPTIAAQTFNVFVFICILVYFTKDKVRELFKGRLANFEAEFRKAKEQKEKAIAERNEIKQRLEDLKVNADKTITEAKQNAKNNTEKFIQLANDQANKIIVDSEGKVLNEKNKLISQIKEELLSKSFNKAKVGLSDSMSKPELEKLNNDFIKNIQVVKQ